MLKYQKPCSYCGISMKLLQISDEKAVYVCSDKACKFYEFSEPVTKWIVVKRSQKEFEKELLAKKKRKQQKFAKKTVEVAELDQLVNNVFSENFQSSRGKLFVNGFKINKCYNDNDCRNSY